MVGVAAMTPLLRLQLGCVLEVAMLMPALVTLNDVVTFGAGKYEGLPACEA